MIVVVGTGQFKNSLSSFKMMALQQARLLELGKYAIYGCKTDVFTFADERLVDILGGQVTNRAAFKQAEDAQSRQSRLQAHGFEIVRFTHSVHPSGCFAVSYNVRESLNKS